MADPRTELRGAVARGDGPALVALLTDPGGWPVHALQLAAALRARCGTVPVPLLRPVSVDLAELAAILEGDPAHGGGRIDLRTGEVWPQAARDDLDEVGEGIDDEDDGDDARFLWVDPQGSRQGYRDMEAF